VDLLVSNLEYLLKNMNLIHFNVIQITKINSMEKIQLKDKEY